MSLVSCPSRDNGRGIMMVFLDILRILGENVVLVFPFGRKCGIMKAKEDREFNFYV